MEAEAREMSRLAATAADMSRRAEVAAQRSRRAAEVARRSRRTVDVADWFGHAAESSRDVLPRRGGLGKCLVGRR